jgi:hypothetical protein
MADLYNMEFLEQCHIVQGNAPVDEHTSGVTGLWVSMREYQACLVHVAYAVGTASDEVAITINQATSSGGASSKGVNFTRVRYGAVATAWSQTTSDIDTLVVQAAASTYTPTGQSGKEAWYAIQINADMMDVEDGFYWLQATLGTPSNSRLCSLLYIMFRNHHPQGIPVGCLVS